MSTTARAVAWIARGFAERAKPRVERALKLMRDGMPEREALSMMCKLDTTSPAIVAAERWAKRRTGLYVLAGPRGTGKSIGAACWATHKVEHGQVKWLDAAAIGNLPPIGIAEELAKIVGAPALVIDEIGGQGATSERCVALIGQIITKRHAACRPTLMTTNLPKLVEQDGREVHPFAMHLDGCRNEHSRIMDRIAEDGEWLDVRGKSRRSAPLPIEEAREKLEKFRRLLRLSEAADAVANGTLDTSPAIEELIEMLKIDDARLQAARDEIEAQDSKIDELKAKLYESWNADRFKGSLDA